MDEDRCRVRAVARALSGVRNAALGIIRRGKLAIHEANENFREERTAAIKAVTGRILLMAPAVEMAPAFLRAFDQLKDHGERSLYR
jgi:hypothetical protein